MDIKVLGIGCANCRTTKTLIEAALLRRGLKSPVGKIEDPAQIAAQGVMATPAVMIDGTIVHAGGVPRPESIERWLDALASPCCGSRAG